AAGSADVGFMNKGGIRCDLEAGDVTFEDVYRLMPFDNTVVSMDLDGAAIRELLDRSVAGGGFPALEWSGLEAEVESAGASLRLRAIRVAGAPLEDAKTYRVATNSFLATGGDGYSAFSRGKRRDGSDRFLRDLLAEDLKARSPLAPPAGERLRVVAPAR
ncbi:MAG: 5'-nucleotidase C-terminal domain-containing protein, partial [Planctomycetota bacterium]